MSKSFISILLFVLYYFLSTVNLNATESPFDSLNYGKVLNSKFKQNIKVKWSGGLPLVDVLINGKSYTFLFDTGAPTTVPHALIKELDLKPFESSVTLNDAAGGMTKTNMYNLPLIQIGDIKFSNFAVLTNDFKSQFPLSCLGFDGIVGFNLLKDLNIKLDLSEQSIVISNLTFETTGFETTNFKYDQQNGIQFEFKFEFGQAYFTLDTGKNGYMQIGDPTVIPEMEKHKYSSRKKYGTFSNSFYGNNSDVTSMIYLVKNISISNLINISSLPITVDNSRTFLVGNKLLKKFEIIIDMTQQKMSFKKKKDTLITENFRDTFGFTPMWNEKDKLFISAITEHTQAYKAGINIGDKIISINDNNTTDFTRSEFCSLMKKLSNDDVSFDTNKELNLTVLNQYKQIKHYHLNKP